MNTQSQVESRVTQVLDEFQRQVRKGLPISKETYIRENLEIASELRRAFQAERDAQTLCAPEQFEMKIPDEKIDRAWQRFRRCPEFSASQKWLSTIPVEEWLAKARAGNAAAKARVRQIADWVLEALEIDAPEKKLAAVGVRRIRKLTQEDVQRIFAKVKIAGKIDSEKLESGGQEVTFKILSVDTKKRPDGHFMELLIAPDQPSPGGNENIAITMSALGKKARLGNFTLADKKTRITLPI